MEAGIKKALDRLKDPLSRKRKRGQEEDQRHGRHGIPSPYRIEKEEDKKYGRL